MDKFIIDNCLLAEFAKEIYIDVEQYINELSNINEEKIYINDK